MRNEEKGNSKTDERAYGALTSKYAPVLSESR
jgi:hypothetical protein